MGALPMPMRPKSQTLHCMLSALVRAGRDGPNFQGWEAFGMQIAAINSNDAS